MVLGGKEEDLGVLETALLEFLFTAVSQVDRYYSKQGEIIKPVSVLWINSDLLNSENNRYAGTKC